MRKNDEECDCTGWVWLVIVACVFVLMSSGCSSTERMREMFQGM